MRLWFLETKWLLENENRMLRRENDRLTKMYMDLCEEKCPHAAETGSKSRTENIEKGDA